MKTIRDWELLVFMDPLHAMEEVQAALEKGEVSEAMEGIKEFIETMSQQDVNTVESFLTLIMVHVLKWKMQPGKRTKSWVSTIKNARREIDKRRKRRPSITDTVIQSLWQEAFQDARYKAADEMDLDENEILMIPPSWHEVFDMEYTRDEIPPFFQ